MQPAAMDAELGKGIAGIFAARLLVEQLAEAIEEAALDVLDRLRFDLGRGGRARVELARRMRKQGDADPELLELGRRLVARGRRCCGVSRFERQRESGDAAADYRDFGADAHAFAALFASATNLFVCAQALASVA